MDNVKKNIGRIWKSKCKYLIIIACALILANGVNLLQASLKFLNKDGEELEEVKSVVITSKTWESKGPGSWKVEKSAEWTDVKKITIKFDVETLGKESGQAKDIILVLDYSLSMKGDKIQRLKEDASELVEFLLSKTDNQMALITFNGPATIQSGFTTDKDKIINAINGTDLAYGTNYTHALENVDQVLSGYQQDENRNLVILFLTDGHPAGGGNGVAQYSLLKEKYPFIIINGIQYELGNGAIDALKRVSDRQYIANKVNLKDVFFETIGVKPYETFEVVDYISSDFYVNHASDIRVSRGKVKLEEIDGRQKIIWTLTGEDMLFITGLGATMEIDAIYKGELSPEKVIPTNEKEEIKTKLSGEESEEEEESDKTPGLRGGYYITYNPNLPKECNLEGTDTILTKVYFPYEIVDKVPGKYTCNGWQIKEWKIDGIEPNLVGDKIMMPSHDVTVKAIWTKLDVNKKMEGTIFEVKKQDLVEAMKENAGTVIGVDTGINFGAPSSETNGRGLYIRSGTESDTNPIYYYRGAVMNNNVLFAGICWQIVRTTESGGVKLIYNGVSSDGKTCNSTGDKTIGESGFNNTSSFGYMYHNSINASCSTISANWRLASTFNIPTKNPVLAGPGPAIASPGPGRHYTCTSDSQTSVTCYKNGDNSVSYVYYYAGKGKTACRFNIGKLTIDEFMEKAFENVNSSNIKQKIDDWYKTNIEEKGYTKYLDINTVWCNDRAMTSGPLYSDTAGFGETIFAATGRRKLNTTSVNPAVKESVACSNPRDRFTASSASVGNKALIYPIGMLTADEVVLGGMTFQSDSNDSYLNIGDSYFTMTPNKWGEEYGVHGTFYVVNINELNTGKATNSLDIRPSISLKPGSKVVGIGTKDDPYEVVME